MDSRDVYRPLPSSLPPLPQRKKWIEVYRPDAGEKLYGFCLNQELAATFTHWDDYSNGKVRCVAPCERCTACEEQRWYGYIPVLCPFRGRVMCFEVTVQAARDCDRLSTKRIPLRGKILTIGRHGKRGKFGRCYAIVEDPTREQMLPPAIDPEELMERVFRFYGTRANAPALVPTPPDGKSRGAGR